ncbi:hypothetical protein BKA93DRAFT_882775 [Sparassis latifolia]
MSNEHLVKNGLQVEGNLSLERELIGIRRCKPAEGLRTCKGPPTSEVNGSSSIERKAYLGTANPRPRFPNLNLPILRPYLMGPVGINDLSLLKAGMYSGRPLGSLVTLVLWWGPPGVHSLDFILIKGCYMRLHRTKSPKGLFELVSIPDVHCTEAAENQYVGDRKTHCSLLARTSGNFWYSGCQTHQTWDSGGRGGSYGIAGSKEKPEGYLHPLYRKSPDVLLCWLRLRGGAEERHSTIVWLARLRSSVLGKRTARDSNELRSRQSNDSAGFFSSRQTHHDLQVYLNYVSAQ